jgi:hypothetical protein
MVTSHKVFYAIYPLKLQFVTIKLRKFYYIYARSSSGVYPLSVQPSPQQTCVPYVSCLCQGVYKFSDARLRELINLVRWRLIQCVRKVAVHLPYGT